MCLLSNHYSLLLNFHFGCLLDDYLRTKICKKITLAGRPAYSPPGQWASCSPGRPMVWWSCKIFHWNNWCQRKLLLKFLHKFNKKINILLEMPLEILLTVPNVKSLLIVTWDLTNSVEIDKENDSAICTN